MQPYRKYQTLRDPLVLPVYLPRRLQELLIIWRDQKAHAADHVEADSLVVVRVYEGNDRGDGLEFQEEVDRVWFAVVG